MWQDIMENPGHMGEIVGRNSNRIAGGKFQINGKEYRLFLNDGQTSNCHLENLVALLLTTRKALVYTTTREC